MAASLRGKSVLSIADLSRAEVEAVLALAAAQKGGEGPEELRAAARGKSLAILFDKSSLRTRIGFEVAMHDLGGHAVYLGPGDVRLGEREPVKDAARVLGRTVHAIAARLSSHETIQELAQFAGVPVINAMSDREHPCQALADVMTIRERKGTLEGLEVAWVGDGNNVCHSLLLIGAMLGLHLRIASPSTYEPLAEVIAQAEALAKESGATLSLGADPQEAVKGADVVETDVWVSAGMEEQATRRRIDFRGYQVNAALLAGAKPDAIVLHCLPAHRREEITDEVMEGPQVAGFEQAENRLHTQRALLALILG